jgi:hypothetical protein
MKRARRVKAALLVLPIILSVALVALAALAACATTLPQPVQQKGRLVVAILFPVQSTTIVMGQSVKSIIEVRDDRGMAVSDAQVALTLTDAQGQDMGSGAAEFGAGDVYRNGGISVAHRSQEGTWILTVRASTAAADGSASVAFHVSSSVSEVLLHKYGFWIDAPTLRNIAPSLVKEQGDAADGMITWGGLIPQPHIFVENWLEVQWRTGDFKLETPEDVRDFMMGSLVDLGTYQVRALGPFERVKFKQWDAWQVIARAYLTLYGEQWMIFYSPEAGKTYAIGTTVALPPTGIDPHAALRDSFEVHPEVNAVGQAPEALPRRLPGPDLISPALGARVFGTVPPIVLRWAPPKELGPDEYFRVRVDYNYSETNTTVAYATRATELSLPAELYSRPNCGVFNWQVTMMRKTGVGTDGQPEGEPISYDSLYWYVEWLYPAGAAPFKSRCPNPQT